MRLLHTTILSVTAKRKSLFVLMISSYLILACFFNASAQSSAPQVESDYFILKTVIIPENIPLEVGGIAIIPDGRVAVSTRHGEIWMIENAYGENNSSPIYTRFASGMHEVLGLEYRDGAFYCTQRGELTKVSDENGDGIADRYEPIAIFDLSGNYHEYAYGPIFNKQGEMFVTLNVAWIDYGESLAKWHGWLMKVKPDGTMEPIATGLRSPAGIMVNSNNDIFYGENQGDWVGSGRVTHLEKGDFAGNAAGLNWSGEPGSPLTLTKADVAKVDNGQPMHEAAKKIKEMKLPMVWFPHTLMGISTSDILEDVVGYFGPYKGQYFVADQGHSKVMRMTLEKINGKYQGACYPFREGFASGILRLRWGVDGSMFAGMTSRGWSSTGRAEYGLQRLVWSGSTPFEMKNISARPDGFEIEFTVPADVKTLRNAMNYELNSFTYKYHHFYGSPIINTSARTLKGIIVSEDGRKVRLVMDSLKEGYIHEIKLGSIRAADGRNLLHNFAYYTMNNIPAGDKAVLKADEVVTKHAHAMPAATTGAKPKASTAKRLTKMPADWGQPDQVIRLGTRPGLKFDRAQFEVKPGSKIRLVFNNNDDMQHNVVITAPGAADDVGNAALKLGLKGSELNYVPPIAKVLYHTALLQPNSSESIYFLAPEKPGTYPFICSYPGHASVMRGVIIVK